MAVERTGNGRRRDGSVERHGREGHARRRKEEGRKCPGYGGGVAGGAGGDGGGGYSDFLISAGFHGGTSIELTINYWRRFRGLPVAVVKHYAFHILLCYLIPTGARALLQ